jgi:glycosyltransferase involved in cell wall biosynthesis
MSSNEDPPPKVSVCIPSYRGAAHLGATIESVLAQSFHEFELVIIDDNSPDDIDIIVAGFNDPRIRYLKNQTNLGPEGNWNRCLKKACGQYFKLLPQDDLLYPDTLQRQIDVLDSDKEEQIAFVFGSRYIIDAKNQIIARRGYPGGVDGPIPSRKLVRNCVRFGTNLIGEPASVLMRKSVADKVGPFDGSIGYVIDIDYWTRLLAFGDGFYLGRPVSAFRISRGSWSLAIGRQQGEAFCQFINRLRAQPQWSIGILDMLAGHVMARSNNLMRLAFYRFALKG